MPCFPRGPISPFGPTGPAGPGGPGGQLQDSGVGETVSPRLILWRGLSNSVKGN